MSLTRRNYNVPGPCWECYGDGWVYDEFDDKIECDQCDGDGTDGEEYECIASSDKIEVRTFFSDGK